MSNGVIISVPININHFTPQPMRAHKHSPRARSNRNGHIRGEMPAHWYTHQLIKIISSEGSQKERVKKLETPLIISYDIYFLLALLWLWSKPRKKLKKFVLTSLFFPRHTIRLLSRLYRQQLPAERLTSRVINSSDAYRASKVYFWVIFRIWSHTHSGCRWMSPVIMIE